MGAAEVLNLNLGVTAIVNNLEGPRLNVLLDDGIIEASANQAPMEAIVSGVRSRDNLAAYLTSKTVLAGFMAAWFLAASPMRRSSSVKETKEGVVKLPCSLAMISTLLPSYVATQEYVVPVGHRGQPTTLVFSRLRVKDVPKSMPMAPS